MPDTYTSRISIVDFFAAILPGFYVVLGLGIFISIIQTGTAEKAHPKPFAWPSTAPSGEIARTVLVVFVSYIVGSVLRALPVGDIDRFVRRRENPNVVVCGFLECLASSIPRALKWLTKWFCTTSGWWKDVSENDFPYWDALVRVEKDLNWADPVPDSHFVPKEEKRSMSVFDYWKMVLCYHEPNVFSHLQSLEARVRFFAGMIWAGGFVMTMALVAVWYPSNSLHHRLNTPVAVTIAFALVAVLPFLWVVLQRIIPSLGWLVVMTYAGLLVRGATVNQSSPGAPWACAMFGVSLLISILLSWRLTWVRAEEAAEVFRAYYEHRRSKSSATTPPTTSRPSAASGPV